MKILIVGFGSIGRRHFRNLVALGIQDIIFHRTGKSTLKDSELEGYPVYQDLDHALAQKPDGVIIANPTAFHLDAAFPAARAGCHILLEKPISHNRERVEEFAQLVKAGGSRVLVGYQFRFHPNLIQIKQLLDDNLIGMPQVVRSHWGEYLPGWHPWEDYRESYSARKDLGGGVLLTLSHSFDYLGWLFGTGRVHSSRLGFNGKLDIDVEDTAEILLEFEEKLIVSVHLNYLQLPGKHTLEIIGTKGTITWDYNQNKVDLVIRTEVDKFEQDTFTCPDDFDRNDLFLEEMDHFLNVIADKASPFCTLEDGILALDLAMDASKCG